LIAELVPGSSGPTTRSEHQAWGGARLTWSLYRDTLTLGPVDGAISPENYFGQPWRRVSSAPKVDRLFAKCQLPEEGIPR
jgi:hypothetical protein